MQNLIHELKAEWLLKEIARQLEAYDQSLVNDEIFEVRKKIAMRIVELEKDLVNLRAMPVGYSAFRSKSCN